MVISTAPASWAQAPGFDISGFRLEGVSVVPESGLQAVLKPFVGANRSMEDVRKAAAAVKDAYAAAGYPIVQVFPPEQTLAAGVVTLRVSEAKLGKVTVAGVQAYQPANIRASLPPLAEGAVPNTDEIIGAVVLANENPAKQVAVNFTPSDAPGAVDARIDVVEEKISKFGVTLDNAGAPASGRGRIGLSYQNANLFARDHVLNLQFMTSARHPRDSANVTLGYRVPFYAQHLSLDVVAAYSDSKSNVNSSAGALFFAGKGSFFGTRLNQALSSRGSYRHKLIYGLDYKDFNNNCNLGGIPLNTCGTITAIPFSISYNGQLSGAALQAGGSISYYRNIAGGPHGRQSDYGTYRRGWQALRASGFVNIPMRDWQLRATVNAQQSNDMLIPSEQFGIGGAASVRGYDERTAAADRGAMLNLELFTPELGQAAGVKDAHRLRAVLFYDAGIVRSNDPMQLGSPHLASAGLGLRYNLGSDMRLRIDAGRVQVASPGTPNARLPNGGFVHAMFSYVY